MLIVDQSKNFIVNFERINWIQVSKVDEKKSVIEINYADGDWKIIAEYKTEERAREILVEIAREFKRILRTENRSTGQQRFYDVPKVYYMPEK